MRLAYRFQTIACATALLILGCAPTIEKTVEDLSYTPAEPPDTLFGPGTIVSVQSSNPFVARTICYQYESMGNDFHAQMSPSTDQQVSDKLSKTFDVSASQLKGIQASLNASSVKSISMNFSNVRVLDASDAMILSAIVKRQSSCQDAVNAAFRHGELVTMVYSVIRADVKYHVEFANSLGASAHDSAMKTVAADLGLSISATGTDDVTGSGLYWGIREDRRLAALGPNGSVISIQTLSAAKRGPGGTERIPAIPLGAPILLVGKDARASTKP